jgi:ATP-dependent Lon protease
MTTTNTTITTTPVFSTRDASRIALTHILDNAFSKAGIDDTVGLLTLDDKAINCLVYSYTDPNGVTTTQKLQRGDVGLLKSFINYIYHCDSTGNPIGNYWLYVTKDMLNEFRTDLASV